MNRTVQVLFLLLLGVFCIETSETTYLLRTKAKIVGIYDQCIHWKQEKIKKQEEQKKKKEQHEKFMKQVMEDAECIKQEQKQKQEEEKKQREEQEERVKQEQYEKYFAEQVMIYQELVDEKIDGVRALDMDVDLAEQMLANCPNNISDIVFDIEQRMFSKYNKNIIFYGYPGTGKSALAQAIAIKCQVPCLFFSAGGISNEYMNSGVKHLNKISRRAKDLVKKFNKPCVVIYDELESLTRKHVGANNPEANIFITFWEQLDELKNSPVIVISTMNSIDDVPLQVRDRTCMIEISLPTQEQREKIASYYLTKIRNQSDIEYPEWLTAVYIAEQTNGFSSRALEKAMTEALTSAIRASRRSGGVDKIVKIEYVSNAINQIKQGYRQEWKNCIKKHLCTRENFVFAFQAIWNAYTHQTGMQQGQANANRQHDQAERHAQQAQENANRQHDQSERHMNQGQANADKQMSDKQIARAVVVQIATAACAAGVGFLMNQAAATPAGIATIAAVKFAAVSVLPASCCIQ